MGDTNEYPDAPGFKASGPSEEAAAAIAGPAAVLRGKVLKVYRDVFPQGRTADAVADQLSMSVLSVRPRVSELHRNGQLAKTAQRGKNASGMTATVWRFVPDAPPIQPKD